MFEVRGQWLFRDGERVPYRPTPNISRARMAPRLIVEHDTADHLYPWDGLSWLTNKSSRVSAHLHIDRHGDVVQLAPFDRITWHAGRSIWNGIPRVNGRAIGIELDNPGKLTKVGQKVRAWFGDTYSLGSVEYAKTPEHGSGWWMPYTSAQLESNQGVLAALGERFPAIKEVLRHCDVSPGRKVDANPLLDMAACRAALLSRRDRMIAHDAAHAHQVAVAQARLNDLGFGAGLEDGDLGTKTKMAIRGFQIENDLPPSDTLDPGTVAAMNSLDAKEMPTGARAEMTEEDLAETSRTMRTAKEQNFGALVTYWSGLITTIVATVQSVTGALGQTGVAFVLIGVGGVLMWSGYRTGWFAKQIKTFRLQDSQQGRHVS